MKQQRHTAIRDLLFTSAQANTAVANQDDLRRRLAAKGPTGYSLPSTPEDEDEGPGIREVLRSFGLEARQAANLLVLITTTGSAQPVAAGIDYEDWPEVVGTIAGDDTVLIICADEKQSSTLKARIEGYIG